MELAVTSRPDQHSFFERLIGAALLRTEIYDEIKRDPNATYQGAFVVLFAGAAGIVQQSMENRLWVVFIPIYLLVWPLMTAVYAVCAKYVLARGTTWEMADWLLRTLAFAFAPNLLLFVIPAEGPASLLRTLISLWSGATGLIALREGLQLGTTGRALWVSFGSACIAGLCIAIWLFVAFFTLAVIVS
jgi:hypothetical protein